MPGKSWRASCFLILAAGLLGSCQQAVNYPAPKLIAISPQSGLAGQPAFRLAVMGANFTPASVVLWNGSARTSFFQAGNEITAQILASDLQVPGNVPVQVVTPAPGGGTTTQLLFTISPSTSPVPQITAISPSTTFTGATQVQITVTGMNFIPLSTVSVNNSNRLTGFTNSTSLQAVIPASDLATSGVLQVTVVNPQPGGGSSNAFSLIVQNLVPTITALSPSGVGAGTSPGTLTVTGTNFVPNSVIFFNDAPRATTFASSLSVSTALTAGDAAAGGISHVQVSNPPPGGGPSNILTFAVNPTASAGLPVLVDMAPDGTVGNNGVCEPNCLNGTPNLATAGPSVSVTGALVAFASNSSNLLTGQTNSSSAVFLRNTCMAAGGCIPQTSMISATPNGAPPNGPSFEPSLDSSGTHAAYTSTATNLVTNVVVSPNNRQVYWQPACLSATCGPAVLVSADVLGNAGNGDSYSPAISPDGQFVAFVSLATNLVSGVVVDGTTPQVYVRVMCGGAASKTCTPTTFLVSSPDGVAPANAPSARPALSSGGTFVAFESSATNLGATAPNPGGVEEVFEQKECFGVAGCTPAASLLVSTPDGATISTPANQPSIEPTVSSDGRFVAFASTATNLISGVGPTQQVYLRDTCTGAPATCVPAIQLVSIANGSIPADGVSGNPTISQCGSGCTTGPFVAFASQASNLRATAPGIENIFVRNTCAAGGSGCTPGTAVASRPGGSSPAPSNGNSIKPAISGDGHTVSFISAASNLVAPNTGGFKNIFLGSTTF